MKYEMILYWDQEVNAFIADMRDKDFRCLLDFGSLAYGRAGVLRSGRVYAEGKRKITRGFLIVRCQLEILQMEFGSWRTA